MMGSCLGEDHRRVTVSRFSLVDMVLVPLNCNEAILRGTFSLLYSVCGFLKCAQVDGDKMKCCFPLLNL